MVPISSFTCATNMVVVLLTISNHSCIFTTYIKGSIFPKNSHFIIQERVNGLVYGINTVIKCGI